MTRFVRFSSVIAILFLLAAGLMFSWGRYVSYRHRAVVYEAPIQLREGFATDQSFTVDVAGSHFLGIGYEKETVVDTRLNPSISGDEFTVVFSVRCNGVPVTQGTASNPNFVILRKGYSIRILADFRADLGKTYDVALRVPHALPALASTNTKMLILPNPEVAQIGAFAEIATIHYATLLATGSFLFSVPVLWHYLRRLWIR